MARCSKCDNQVPKLLEALIKSDCMIKSDLFLVRARLAVARTDVRSCPLCCSRPT